MDKNERKRFAKLARERALKKWGKAWAFLSPEQQESALSQEALAILMCQQMDKYDAAKNLMRACMGWD